MVIASQHGLFRTSDDLLCYEYFMTNSITDFTLAKSHSVATQRPVAP